MNILSFSPFGYEGALVTVEVDLRRGIPAVDMVGLADNAVKEARERMRVAIRNSGYDFPAERVLISLSPADVKKEGSGFDLAIALAVLDAKYKSDEEDENPEHEKPENAVLIMGELELSGKVRAVRGVHAAVSTAAENGCRYCIVPAENAEEAAVFTELEIISVDTLEQARNAFCALKEKCLLKDSCSTDTMTKSPAKKAREESEDIVFSDLLEEEDFATVSGQPLLVRALQIAAAGGHNCLVFGPPGCGKTLAIQRFPSLLPQLTSSEARAVTRIYSLAGLLPKKMQLIKKPPFRMPHQGASLEGMIGGGLNCRPGEISLAHNGVLFLDEAAEFRTSVLQALRVPLETGRITLSRAGRHTTFPSRFQLILATNPCPCGNFGVKDRICLCSARSVELYWKKFSAPLLDRIDIRVPVTGNAVTLVQKNSSGSGAANNTDSADNAPGTGNALGAGNVFSAATNGAAPANGSKYANDKLFTSGAGSANGEHPANGETSSLGAGSANGAGNLSSAGTAPLTETLQTQPAVNTTDTPANTPQNGNRFSSRQLRIDIARAIATQNRRQHKKNCDLVPEEIQYFCKLSSQCEKLMESAIQKYGFSARAVHSCIKVARTIADMAGAYSIRECDLQEAIDFRKSEGGLDILL